MTLPRYPAYRDSGEEWVGLVPAHWESRKLKHLAKFSGGGTPSREEPSYWRGAIPWVSPKDMKSEAIEGAEECITEEGLANSSASLVAPGHVLMVVRSGILKHTIPVAINRVPVALNQDMKAIAFDRQTCLPGFFARWVQGLNDELLLAWAKQGATVESIEHAYLAETSLPLPPVSEQQAITTFLDREAAKIDALIAEQEKLIALLAEKRQATISHAVTRGLNPNAPMKDSGVPWLGEVPAHWEVVGLTKYLSSVVDYRGRTPTKVDEGVFLVTAKNIREGRIDYEASQEFIAADEYQEVMRRGQPCLGDVLFTTEAPLGQVALVDRDDIALAQRVIKFRAEPSKLIGPFLMYWIMGNSCQADLLQLATGSTALGIKGSKVGMVRLCLPPLHEQAEIVEHITQVTSELDRVRSEASEAIGLLNERRSALIAAAVTGQIDVRGLTPA